MNYIWLNNEHAFNLDSLVETRLLIQANSGGGKSWLIRRILEQSHSDILQIVIDLEGEFSTLREEYDYLLISEDGDIPIEMRSAKLLAQEILRLNISTIIDLYELKKEQRAEYLKKFLDALIAVPKSLYRPCLVVIDEAHQFAPQSGNCIAKDSVIDLMTRGRKRGFCGILATQRISKLHKDACAEANNKLIGRTGLDIDMARASDELGFISKEQKQSLRTLNPGEFFAFGPSISNRVTSIKIGGVQTTHPRVGQRVRKDKSPTPPTDRIKNILKELINLPEKAEQEIKTIQQYQDKISKLERELKSIKKDKSVIDADQSKVEVANLKKEFKQEIDSLELSNKKVIQTKEVLKKAIRHINKELKDILELSDNLLIESDPDQVSVSKPKLHDHLSDSTKARSPKIIKPVKASDSTIDLSSNRGDWRILLILAKNFPMKFTKSQLGTLAKVKVSGGSFSTYMSRLRSKDLIREENNLIFCSDEGLRYMNIQPDPPSTSEEKQEMWINLFAGGAKRMLEVLIDEYPDQISKDTLSDRTDISRTGGSFSTYLSRLRTNGLIEDQGESIRASDLLFE